jgi:hypothetical protein
VKKLISIGVALALLTMAVLPGAVGAYTEPQTFAKIPFAILQSGLEMVGSLMTTLAPTLGLPDYLDDIINTIAPWTGGPLSWTVDMLGWGLALVGDVLTSLATTLGLPDWLDDLVNTIACGLFTPFANVTGPAFSCP